MTQAIQDYNGQIAQKVILLEKRGTLYYKQMFLFYYERSLGSILKSCKNSGIARSTFYNWMATDLDFKKAIQELEDRQIDFVENKLYELIVAGDGPSIRYYLDRRSDKWKPKKIMQHHMGDVTLEDLIDRDRQATS